MTDSPPAHLVSWRGVDWAPSASEKAAHPNSRFTVSTSQCPSIDPEYQSSLGVPISGIIFGGRRSHTVPLVRQALSWQHGVFLGASMTSETTAAATGEVGKLRHDPFAMLPFCGYNMGDYFAHWLAQDISGRKLPEIFYVNWFLKDSQGKFIWPGYGENIRVLKWMCERIDGIATARKSAIGYLPEAAEMGVTDALFDVGSSPWREEAKNIEAYFAIFGDKLPRPLVNELETLRLSMA
jgi:phosphoenolpyruvate carboxykinase (GTP)